MSNNRYIELSSTYRNRNLYPNPAEFEVQIASSGSSTLAALAQNPLSKAYPTFNFTGAPGTPQNAIPTAASDFITMGTFGLGLGSRVNLFGLGNASKVGLDIGHFVSTAPSPFFGEVALQNSASIDGYYDGMTFVCGDNAGGIPPPTGGHNTSSRIIYFDGEKRMVELENSINTGGHANYYINNESEGDSTTKPTVRIQGGQFVDNFYTGAWLECCSLPFTSQIPSPVPLALIPDLDRFKRIINYNHITRIAKLESNYTVGTFPNDWRKNMSYRIRRQIPLVMGWGTHAQGINENAVDAPTLLLPNNNTVPYNTRYYSRWEPFNGSGLTVNVGPSGLGTNAELIDLVITPGAAGLGYVVGDVLDVLARGPGAPPVDPLGAVILITSVSAGGVVSEFRIIDGGSGYIGVTYQTAPQDNHIIKGPCQPFIQGFGCCRVPVLPTLPPPASTTSTIPRGGVNGQNNTPGSANSTSGTGPGPGRNGAAYRVSLVTNENGVAGSGYTVSTTPVTTTIVGGGIGNGLTIIIERVDALGQIVSIRIGQPGGDYSPASFVTVDGGTTLAQVRIEAVGQSVDISNAVQTDAIIFGPLGRSGSHVGQLLYISSKGPERYPNPVNGVNKIDGTVEDNPFTGPVYQSLPEAFAKSSNRHHRVLPIRNNGTATGITPIGKSQQLPAQLEFDPISGFFNNPSYNSDTTGSAVIMGFFRESSTGVTKGTGAIIDIINVSAAPLQSVGNILAITVTNPGSGYIIGDYLTTLAGGGTGAVFVVTKVNGSGGIIGIAIVNGGTGYAPILNINLIALTTLRDLAFFVISPSFEVPVGVDSLEATLLLTDGANVITNPLIRDGSPGTTDATYHSMLRSGTPIPVDWEIQQFFCDGVQPYIYTGSTVSQNQMVCYQVSLNSLLLPNVILESALGGFVAFYPYVYVEIQNVTAPSGRNRNIIYSNNPNSTMAIFKAAIDNTPTPVVSKFIRINGDGEVQTIKFKPNDNLKMRVYFGDGETFRTLLPDNAPPLPANPFLQISALFEIDRL